MKADKMPNVEESPSRPHSARRWRDHDGRTWIVDIEFDTVDGRAEPVSVRVYAPLDKPAAVTGEVVRRVPLGAFIAAARRSHAEMLRSHSTIKTLTARRRRLLADAATLYEAKRPRQLSADILDEVARLYREAWASGGGMTEAVAGRYNISLSAADKRIAAARRAKKLGPARPGSRGGEVAPARPTKKFRQARSGSHGGKA